MSARRGNAANTKAKKQGRGTVTTKAPGQQPRARTTIPHFLDPLCAMPAPTVTSGGKALPHTSLVSADFVVSNAATTILLVTNTGDSGTVGYIMNVDSAGAYLSGLQLLTVPTLALADSAGGPSSSRAMKFSVSVVNCSNALKRGGRVTYLNSSQRLPASLGAGQFGTLVTGVKNSPYRRRITGDMLCRPLQLIGYPVDTIEYTSFKPHRGTLTDPEFLAHVLNAGPTISPSPRPMSAVAYIFDPTADSQDYSVTIRASMYTRWPLTSVPGQSMSAIPTAHPSVINTVHDHAEGTANDLGHVVEGGVLATVAPKVAGAARSAIGGMLGRAGDAIRGAFAGAEGAAADVLGEGAALVAEEAALAGPLGVLAL